MKTSDSRKHKAKNICAFSEKSTSSSCTRGLRVGSSLKQLFEFNGRPNPMAGTISLTTHSAPEKFISLVTVGHFKTLIGWQ